MNIGGGADGDDWNAWVDSEGRFSNAKNSADFKQVVQVLSGWNAFTRRVEDLANFAIGSSWELGERLKDIRAKE